MSSDGMEGGKFISIKCLTGRFANERIRYNYKQRYNQTCLIFSCLQNLTLVKNPIILQAPGNFNAHNFNNARHRHSKQHSKDAEQFSASKHHENNGQRV